MLASLLGIRLMLLAGATVPRPPPAEVMKALADVEVTNDDSSTGDGFQLTFACARNALGEYDVIQSRTFEPMTRVVIAVVFGVLPEVLIDGVVTHSQFNPGNGPGQATFTVTGKDLTVAMDLEEKNATYENQPDFVIVTTVLKDYARYGLTPLPKPTTDVPLMIERIPRQQETDLRFIERLATRNGFVFYIEPLTVLVNKAYWGPENRLGVPQPALSIDQGSITNVKSINFSNDALAATGTRGVIVEPFTRMRIPIPALPSLRMPPLAAQPATPYRTTLQRDTANRNPATAATRMLAAATNRPDSASASGDLDAVRYGHALRARKLVGVSGAGLRHDGFWYVRSVTHSIRRGEYSQRFSLSREGSGTTTPVVPR